jgi:aryl-alcohol dehydrogenase-like predicted oxidoreductase
MSNHESLEEETSQHAHPHTSPNKLQGSERVSADDVHKLRRRLDALEQRTRQKHDEPERSDSANCMIRERRMLAGYATREGIDRFAARFAKESITFYRPVQDILVSSLGIGTNRGAKDNATDISYARSVHAALQGSINLIDTSLNYRHQRSERAVAAGIGAFVENSGGSRDGIVVCTKGGYVVPDAVAKSTLSADDATGGTHSISPAFLADQIERSRLNLGLETIDVYYLHNPETQLMFIDMPTFMNQVRAAFDYLEHAVSDGLIRYYGTATWDGYRTGALSLRALAEAARQIAGDKHHFRFVQLPFNLGMQEALTRRVDGGGTVLDVAAERGITVIASASLLQARLTRDLPMKFSSLLPSLYTDAQRAIHFARSTPGISSALVGMRDVMHVMENLAVARIPLLTSDDYRRFSQFSSESPETDRHIH